LSRFQTIISVSGEFDRALRCEFDDLAIESAHGLTHLRVATIDPAVVHGVMGRIEALGLQVLEVHRSEQATGRDASSAAEVLPTHPES
jgi:hypothetical protein